jgi:hypothetical protein
MDEYGGPRATAPRSMFGSETMFLERSRVSRKTPKDGKLEITEGAAALVSALSESFDVVVNGERGAGSIDRMSCTCRGAENAHTHHFLQSELLKRLPADSDVSIDLLEDAGAVVITNAPAAR